MSGYAELRELGVTVRPLSDPKPRPGGTWGNFRAPLSNTIDILATELRALDAKRVVLELDLRERDIRVDGLPRADARPSHDGVALAFDSRFGPLRYETAEYSDRWGVPGWQSNLRAIALSMRALRAVDRYGVSKRGEQYRGWRQIAERSMDAADAITTREEAERFLAEHGGFKEAAAKFHPDRGGDEAMFRAAVRARELVGGKA